MAIAQDLGSATSTSSVIYALEFTADPAINYLCNARASYDSATYKGSISAVGHFLDGYTDATSEASALDANIDNKATSAAGTNYFGIIILSVPQAYGTADPTIPGDTLDTNDLTKMFTQVCRFHHIQALRYSPKVTNMVCSRCHLPSLHSLLRIDPGYIRLLLKPGVQYLDGLR